MALPELKELCLAPLVSSAERFLAMQWSDGRFEVTPEYETEVWNQFHQQYILAAALLYTTEHPANPWRGSERLWQAMLRSGRHIASHVDANGAMLWNLNEHHMIFCDQRLLCAWLLAYEMLESQLPQEDARLWREAILRGCDWLWAHHVFPYRETQKFTAHPDGVNTGTNHFSLYLALLHRAGRRFGRPEWVTLCTDLMHRLLAAQAPAGYWLEHEGPALGYNYLTYHGVDEYTAWSGDQAGLDALRRGLDLHRDWTYPDGVGIECIDGRMRHTGGPFVWGLSGFARWPDGRGYARLLLSHLKEDSLSGETAAKLAEAYLLLSDRAEGEETPTPQLQPRYRSVLEGSSVVRKEGPWVIALSGQCASKWEDNPFILDRQCLLSVWRQGVGLVLDGSNSKRQPELATFHRGAGPQADHLPLSVQLLPAVGAEEAIAVEYGSFRAAVRVRLVDPRTVEVIVSARGGEGQPVLVTLVPAVHFGESVTVYGDGGVHPRVLGEEPFSFDLREHGGVLAFGKVRLLLPGGTRVEYPISPFNSYHARNISPPGANRLLVTCPAGRGGVAFRVQVED